MQVDPIKPTLKPTGTKRLKLKCDTQLSTSAFNFNLRRYIEVRAAFPRGQTFLQCVALLLAKDGTLSLPMPPKTFLGRGAHLDAAMAVGSGRERRFRVYEEATSFRPGPRVMTRAQARGDRVVLSIVDFPLASWVWQMLLATP